MVQSTLAERFRTQLERRMAERGLSGRQLSLAAGKGTSLVKEILNETSVAPKLDTVEAIAAALGCSPLAMLQENEIGHADTIGETTLLPVYDLRLSAGPGAWCEDDGEPVTYQPFHHAWLRSITNAPVGSLVIARVEGDSMWETLHDGDQVLLDMTRKTPTRDGIYGIRCGDDLMVKRISVNIVDRTLTITSDNPRYESQRGVSPDSIAILGRVIWIGRCL